MVDQEYDPEAKLLEYLNQTRPQFECLRRVVCCESSRSVYCPECCRLCVPEEYWPPAILEGRLQFPLNIDLILCDNERKTSSTGVSLAAIAKAVDVQREKLNLKQPDDKVLTLYDLGKTTMPNYSEQSDGVYVLFPAKDSVPISSVSPTKLVVLDIKWTKQTVKFHPEINKLPKVHLDNPPAESHFWRWHNSGKGMLSTIEAVYFATMETSRDTWSPEQRDGLLHMMWLFALQHSVIHKKSEMEQRPQPFSEEGKQRHRRLRMQHAEEKPHRSSIYDTR